MSISLEINTVSSLQMKKSFKKIFVHTLLENEQSIGQYGSNDYLKSPILDIGSTFQDGYNMMIYVYFINEWQNHSLSDTNYPYLMTDVLYIKIREDNRILSKSCYITIGITEGGDREISGFMIQNEESDDTWFIFFEYLKERGLKGTELVISDAHKGLVSAIRKLFTNESWQRCQVTFYEISSVQYQKRNQNRLERR